MSRTTPIVCAPCPERLAAQRDHALWWDEARQGWVFPGAAPRRMSARARFLVFSERDDRAHPDPTGEPYVWTVCPFCGGDPVFAE